MTGKSLPARKQKQNGIALIMVLFVIALTAALTAFIASSTYFGAKLHKAFVQRAQAEYILKSALNVARVLISTGQGDVDPPKDSWGPFAQGMELDARALGINIPNATVGLEISAIDAKMSVLKLIDSSNGAVGGQGHDLFLKWRDRLSRLFQNLGFDQDNETVLEGQFKGRVFTSEELVANLIDYLDEDTDSYPGENGFATGIESKLAKDLLFPNNKKEALRRLEELENIPGFTAKRIRALSPHVTTSEVDLVNVNLASGQVLQGLDPAVTAIEAQALVAYARGPDGPFDQSTLRTVGPTLVSSFDTLAQQLTTRSRHLQVIAKTQFGGSRYFLRAYLTKEPGTTQQFGTTPPLPTIIGVEMYG